jgi:transcriptional regulator with XRE-family HTH domain
MIRFNLNIKSLREQKKMTQSDLANALDLKRTAISNYERDDSSPNLETLIQISKYFDIKIDDLLYKDLSLYENLENESILNATSIELRHGNVMFLGHIQAVAGYSVATDNQTDISYFNIPDLPKSNKPYLAIRIAGDSMEPSFHTGDIVVCYKIEQQEDFRANNYYIINHRGEVRFKFVHLSADNPTQLILKSINPIYTEETVSLNEVELFRVIASINVKLF